jgi:hypothetical protein
MQRKERASGMYTLFVLGVIPLVHRFFLKENSIAKEAYLA